MCIMSMVMNEWWPKKEETPGLVLTPPPPNAIPWPQIQKDPELAAQMLEVIQRLEAIDKRLGLLEQCKVSEPEKKKVKARLRKIAAKRKK